MDEPRTSPEIDSQTALDPGRPYALASICLGVISIPLAFVPIVGFLSYVIAVIGIVSGLIARKKATVPANAALAGWGILLCLIGIVIVTAWLVIFAVFD